MITAKQLAEELLKNPDDIVCVTTSNFEQGHSTILATLGGYRFKGKVVDGGFRDAFDGGSYTSKVVRMDEKSDQTFIKL